MKQVPESFAFSRKAASHAAAFGRSQGDFVEHGGMGGRPTQSGDVAAPCGAVRRPHRRAWWTGLVFAAAASSAAQAQDGYYDATWAAGGRQMVDLSSLDDAGVALVIQRDGKLVLGGHCAEVQAGYAFCAARLRGDGQPDLSFGPSETGRILLGEQSGFPPYNALGWHGLALQPDGRILMAGAGQFHCGNGVTCYSGMLVRLSAAGHLEPTPGGSAYQPVSFSSHLNENYRHNAVSAVLAAPDGKIIVAGDSARAGTNPPNRDFGIARFNANLSADHSFNGIGTRLGAFDLGGDYFDAARDLALQPDNKIVIGGYARGADGRLKAAVLRLNADGSADQNFGNGGRAWFDGMQSSPGNIFINAVAIDRQGRIVVAGARQIWDGTDHDFFVARLDAQGQLDASFNGGGIVTVLFDLASPAVDEAWDLVVQSDGRILVTGSATRTSAPTYSFAAARLTANGQLDPAFGVGGKSVGTFAPPSQTAASSDIAYASAIGNGGLMVAGNGRAQGGDFRFGVAKLQLDAIFADGFQP